MILVGPLRELDLRDQLRLDPPTSLHHFSGKSDAAAGILRFRKIRERTHVRFECAHAVLHFSFDRRYESVADLRNEDQPAPASVYERAPMMKCRRHDNSLRGRFGSAR